MSKEQIKQDIGLGEDRMDTDFSSFSDSRRAEFLIKQLRDYISLPPEERRREDLIMECLARMRNVMWGMLSLAKSCSEAEKNIMNYVYEMRDIDKYCPEADMQIQNLKTELIDRIADHFSGFMEKA